MTELEKEYAVVEEKRRRHAASTPPKQEGNAGLLDHLPTIEVDLNLLPPDGLRRFLEAFRVEIRYDVRTRHATFRAQISAETIDRLTQQADSH